jgi:hypothetical protein
MYYLWHGWVFAFQFPLYAMATGGMGLLTLEFRARSAEGTAGWDNEAQETLVATLIRLFLQLKQPFRDLRWPLLSSFFFFTGLEIVVRGAISIGARRAMACPGEFDRAADEDDSSAELSVPR